MPKSRSHKNARDRSRRKLKKGKDQYVIRKSSGDLVAIQIAIQLKKGFRKKDLKALNRELIESMIRHKAETSSGIWDNDHCSGCRQGEDPPGMRLVIIRWRNPDRLAAEDTGWRYADPDSPSEQDEAWGTLRRIIQAAPLGVRVDR
jgi:hypothetical protein